ncbi:MAG: SDR family NAD(P)-dependent oxidoreductase [Aequorivita antarctica]
MVLTGGAAGIGKKTIVHFLKEGAQVYAVDINEEALRNLEKELNNSKFNIGQ